MIEKWRMMSASDRIRAQILLGFGMIALYAPFYLSASGPFAESEKMLSRRLDRIEKRTYMELSSSGPSVRTMEKRLAQVTQRLKAATARVDTMDAGFAPANSVNKQQELKLEIATLAEQTGVQLWSVARRGFSAQKGLPTRVFVDPVSGRPQLDIKAVASFPEFIRFLYGLKTLSVPVSVMNVKIYAQDLASAQVKIPRGQLSIYLELSM